MDFSSDLSSGSSGDNKMNSGALMEQVKVQIAMANVQELIERVTDKCFKKCIGKPGTSLDNTEQISLSFAKRMHHHRHPEQTTNSFPTAHACLSDDANSRNASQCAWTGTWTRGTPCHVRTARACKGKGLGCDGSESAPLSRENERIDFENALSIQYNVKNLPLE
uniref:mitochondrial import inner membrane translocase subunit Tim13 isoform X2 n=1 Tax=Myxine glutinosa TaxID=7769 RepID=UPI00358F0AE2